jgi:hypothetical protein
MKHYGFISQTIPRRDLYPANGKDDYPILLLGILQRRGAPH